MKTGLQVENIGSWLTATIEPSPIEKTEIFQPKTSLSNLIESPVVHFCSFSVDNKETISRDCPSKTCGKRYLTSLVPTSYEHSIKFKIKRYFVFHPFSHRTNSNCKQNIRFLYCSLHCTRIIVINIFVSRRFPHTSKNTYMYLSFPTNNNTLWQNHLVNSLQQILCYYTTTQENQEKPIRF